MYREIIRSIDKAHLFHKLFVKRSLENGIYFQKFSILRYIYEHSECNQSEIAKYFHVSPATIAVSTKKLEKSGFIKKTADENNLRCKLMSLTESGKNEVLRIEKIFDDYDKNIVFSGFTQSELESLLNSLNKINNNMKKAEGILSAEDDDDDVMAEIISRLFEKDKKIR